MSLYSQRGVSAQKEDVHAAIKNLDKGLYENAFCRIYKDYISGDDDFVNVMHADGAGTKSILAYLYWKETGDVSVWRGIAQDAIVMNLDDLLCVGIHDNILFSSTIDRNKSLVPAELLEQIINGTKEFLDELKGYNINIHFLGGETADVGDVVRTITVNGTMMARCAKDKLITNENIHAGNVIVGFASFGKASYEDEYNSGIGSNGLTSARHDVLQKYYAEKYPESFDPSLSDDVIYIGKHALSEEITVDDNVTTTIGKLLLSPTRTYAPLVKNLLEKYFDEIDSMIHCSGGGQTKCMKYLPSPLKIIKDNLFEPPEIFKIIQQNSNADNKEMYQVFNMGHRLEIFTNESAALDMIEEAKAFNIEAKIIGRAEVSNKKELELITGNEIIKYLS